ncbi:hypothetical protein ACIBQX_25715 [Nonomuraea sp. NPDC049714]|uniref:hypothetical protein n=1 Tax=Nonomuraea sp. NPDC049714 TaxID=3364357 RepID=UPI0037A468B8
MGAERAHRGRRGAVRAVRGRLGRPVLVAVASFGFAGHLGTQERYLAALPERMRGQGLGLAGSGMLTGQALAASLTGALAEGVTVMVSPVIRLTVRPG